jgi:hypothetical protein
VGQPLVQPIEGKGGAAIEVGREGQEQAANYENGFFQRKLLQPAPELGQAEQDGKRGNGKSNIHRCDQKQGINLSSRLRPIGAIGEEFIENSCGCDSSDLELCQGVALNLYSVYMYLRQ